MATARRTIIAAAYSLRVGLSLPPMALEKSWAARGAAPVAITVGASPPTATLE